MKKLQWSGTTRIILSSYRGIVLKDLVATDSQLKDYTDKSRGSLNLAKYQRLLTQLGRIRENQVITLSNLIDSYKIFPSSLFPSLLSPYTDTCALFVIWYLYGITGTVDMFSLHSTIKFIACDTEQKHTTRQTYCVTTIPRVLANFRKKIYLHFALVLNKIQLLFQCQTLCKYGFLHYKCT